MLKDHLGNTRVLYGNPFEGNNLLLNTDCNNLEYFLSAQDVTRTLETINGESYIKFVSNQNTSTPGMISTGSINVQPGEKYTFKVKGFRANSADSPAHLYVWSDATENLLWPGANLPYGLENENWVHNDFVIPEGVTSIRLGVLWREGYGLSIGDTFYLNEVALFKHQDDDHTTGFEVSEQSDDALEFNNYQTEKINNTGAYSRSGSSAYRLTGSTQVSNEVIGPAKSIRVYPGDAVHMVVYGKYLPATGSGTNVGAVISGALQNAFGLSSGGATDAAYQSIGNLFGDGAIIGTAAYPDEDEVSPRAFLNYILFDDNYVPYDFGYDQIETAGEMPGGIDKMALVAKVRRPGYIYIYLSNENEVAQEVYFDDLAIKHVKGVAIQQNDYYPFGLTFNSYQRENSTPNQNLYQGKELQDELGLEIYDFQARGYDPMLGRTWQTDPMSEMFYDHSPYSWVKNNPLLRIDPTGMTDFTFNKKSGEVIQVGEANDEPDRILKTNNKGEVKYKKNGEAKVAMGGIEQGILADGQNWKTDDQVIGIGGEGQASVDGVKSFTMGLSEYLGKEIKGFSYSSNASGNVTDMVLGKYLNNSNTESYGTPNALRKKYGDDFSLNNITQEFHTHPDGKLGATQSSPNLSQDVTSLQNDKPFIPSASFIILYRAQGQQKPAEYDYTHEYRAPRKKKR